MESIEQVRKIIRGGLEWSWSFVEKIFEEEFEHEILFGERVRATILSSFYFFALLWLPLGNLINPRFFSQKLSMELLGLSAYYWIIYGSALAVTYELITRYLVGYFLRTRKRLPMLLRYINSFVEISFPSFILILASFLFDPVYALYIPMFLIYFIYIALSALQLSMPMSLFTGTVAAIEYFIIALVALYRADPAVTYPVHFDIIAQIERSLLLFITGLATGFVGIQIRKRIRSSYRSIEERKEIIKMFGQHVSPEVVNKLLSQETENLSEMRYVCVMFLDIRNFTTYTEGKEPEEVIGYLNNLFDFMIDIINRNNGIINKFLGDGFMAIFGAPVSDGQDRQNAVRASREIIDRLNEDISAGSIIPTGIGIGLHAGTAVTGHVGSSIRKEYTIIGDVVNIASRLEQLNKVYNSQIIISREVLDALDAGSTSVEDLGEISLKGRREPVHLYKLV